MKSFTDNKGRTWTLEVNVAAIKRVRGLCKVDLNSIVEVDSENRPTAHLLEQLSSDPVLLVDVLYAICKPEADKLGVSDEDFLAFKTAYFTNTPMSLFVTDGAATAHGLDADFSITGFTVEQNLEEAVSVKITAKPTASGRAPAWV